MSLRTVENERLVDGEKIDNLPADTNDELSQKVNEAPVDGNPYARADAGWVIIPGGGDMLIAVYDPQGIADDAFDLINMTGTLPVAQGGTGGVTATEGFDVLSPTALQYDTIINDGVNNIAVKNNQTIGVPGVSNDNVEGYSVGSRWIDTSTGKEHVATNVNTGAAVWLVTTVPFVVTKYMIVEDQKTNGTGAGTGGINTWLTRTLNTTNYNTISGSSLLLNQITLSAGTYKINMSTTGFDNNGFQGRFQNITGATTVFACTSGRVDTSDPSNTQSIGSSVITIVGPTVFEAQMNLQSNAINNLGQSCGRGINEVYTRVEIEQLSE